MRSNWKFVFAAIAFALCIAPTIISYQPYLFRWDDADYLFRSITGSQAFWSGNMHDLRIVMVGDHPPVMTFLGLPWGPLGSWDAAGKCFLTLAALTSFFAAVCLYLLLRSGIKLSFLVIASICVFAAIGPFPGGSDAHYFATALMADSLFAWCAVAAILLISYEGVTAAQSDKDGILRGILWAAVLSVGAITKISFFYFIAVVVPILFFVRMRRSGLRSAVVAVMSLAVCALPVSLFWLRYGLPSLLNGWAASFGHNASFYYDSLTMFVGETVRQSPGIVLSWAFVIAGFVYLLVKRRNLISLTNTLPFLVLLGYCIISLATKNREIRYLLAGIIAPPFLIALLLSADNEILPNKSATMASALAFCCLLAAGLPVLHRADRHSLDRSDAVLAEALELKAKNVLLATDSPSLNLALVRLTIAVSSARPSIYTDTLAWRAAYGSSLEDDLRAIHGADLVVLQDKQALNPPFTNTRVADYEQYLQKQFNDAPVRVAGDVTIYRVGYDVR